MTVSRYRKKHTIPYPAKLLISASRKNANSVMN